jgi:peptidoglycan hydrolase-like protein with peptidoglycan-binding domain
MIRLQALAVCLAAALALAAAPAAAQSVDDMPAQIARSYVETIQTELIAHGYRPGPIDGVMGPRTRAAIQAYQRDAGLPVDGIASKQLAEHLLYALPRVEARTASAPALDPVLVRGVQIELIERGYYQGELDGIAGPQTRGAVRAFQQDAGLAVTGAVDQRLLEQLRAASPAVRATN